VLVGFAQMNIEFDPFDLAASGPVGVKMVVVQGKLRQFPLDLVEVHAQINHGPHEHVAADAAEDIKIKGVQSHFSVFHVF
jgi:hypothetical protein